MLKSILKFSFILIIIIGFIFLGFILFILFQGKSTFNKSVLDKNYLLIKVCLKINPKLIETKIDEYSYAFEHALFYRDFKMIMILEPYTKKFNFKNKNNLDGGDSRILEDLSSGDFNDVLEYLFKNDLIRKKAELDRSYQEYLDYLLFCFAYPPTNNNTGKILMKYGASPFFFEAGLGREFPCIISFPEYLEDCYEKEGINAFIKFDKLIKEKKFYQEQDILMAKELKGTGIEISEDSWKSNHLPDEILKNILKVLASFEKKKLLKEELEIIREIKRYIVEVESVNLNTTNE